MAETKKGLTKGAGWQFGIRKTVTLPLQYVWDYLFSDTGMKLWAAEVDKQFSTYKEYSHIRTKWKPKGWSNQVTLQLRIIPGSQADKTTIAVHIDQLLSEQQREQVKAYWTEILAIVTQHLLK